MKVDDVLKRSLEYDEDKETSVETVETDEEGNLSVADSARLALQGLTLNFGDEGLGYLKSILSNLSEEKITAEEAIKQEREILERA